MLGPTLTQGLNTQGGVLTFELNAPLLAQETPLPIPYTGRRSAGGGGGKGIKHPLPFVYQRAAEQQAPPPLMMSPMTGVSQPFASTQAASTQSLTAPSPTGMVPTPATWPIWLAVGGALALGLGIGVLLGFHVAGTSRRRRG